MMIFLVLKNNQLIKLDSNLCEPHTFEQIKQWCDTNVEWARKMDELNPQFKPYILERARYYMERRLTDSERAELMLRYG